MCPISPRIAHVVCPGLSGVALLAVAFALAVGCSSPTPTPSPTPIPIAEDGDRAIVHYHGTLDDGSVFDSSRDGFPLDFIVGSGQVVPGFDDAVRGLALGESTTVRIEPTEAYGDPISDLIVAVPLDDLPPDVAAQLSVGMILSLSETIQARVTEITAAAVTLDANHPLAGEALTFEIDLVDLIKPTPEATPAEDDAPQPTPIG